MSKLKSIRLLVSGCALALMLNLTLQHRGQAQETFSPYVDARGGITVPPNYRTSWVFLGTWSIDAVEGTAGAKGLHNVFTQPGVVEAHRIGGEFPDGTVLVKELLSAETHPMTTGTVSYGVDIEGWFVMVRDTKNRFPNDKLWGDGWGWALFGPNGMLKTTDYKAECLGCHVPAKATEWVYIQGYPLLR